MRIGVIGASRCNKKIARIAYQVGKEIAKRKAILICGGLGGVMEEAARGAKENKGLTIGILPGFSSSDANSYIDIPIVTGMDHGRNIIVVRSCDAIIAVGGREGTLSEIAFALKLRIPLIGIETWKIKGVIMAKDAQAAVSQAFQVLKREKKIVRCT
ncbi:TIGR00725 family protein [bacterium]|nr:TIGR00725 family protein [bacterium]